MFGSKGLLKATKSLSALVIFAIGLSYDTCLEAVVSRCVLFLDSLFDDGILVSIVDILYKYVGGIELPELLKGKTADEAFKMENTVTKPEALSSEALAIWETLKKGVFTKHLSYVVGTVFAFATCKIKNVEFSHPIVEKVMEHSQKDTIDAVDLVDHVVKLFNWVSTVGVACVTQKSLKPLFLNSGTLSKCHEKLYYWTYRYEEIVRSKDVDTIERTKMYVEVETLVKTLMEFTKIERDKFTTLQASSLHAKALELYNKVRDFVCKIDAVQVAFAIHLWGQPKVGKSYITPLVHEQVCLARGADYDESRNAQLNLMAPFQDEIVNSTQTITCNETLPTKITVNAQSAERSYNVSLALVDSCPFHPNKSSLEEKAKVTAQHISVISSGNTEQPYKDVATTPEAWCRRYLSVNQRVKPEFADEFGRMGRHTDGSNDYHLFDVYEIVFVPRQGTNTTEQKRKYFKLDGKDSVDLSTKEFLELIRILAINHFANEDKLLKIRSEKKHSGCKKCKRVAFMCKCVNGIASQTLAHQIACEAITIRSGRDCPERQRVAGMQGKCFYENGYCTYCNDEEPSDDSSLQSLTIPKTIAEMGIFTKKPKKEASVTRTIVSGATNILWTSCKTWLNPFVNIGTLLQIDKSVWDSTQEELVEELQWIPDTIGTTALSMIPPSWLIKQDGTPSWLGRRKDQFLKLLACEQQIFTPLSIIFKRAFTLSVIVSLLICFLTWSFFRYATPVIWLPVIKYEEQWHMGWKPLFPQYTKRNMMFKRYMLKIGFRDFWFDIFGYGMLIWQDFLGMFYYYWIWKEQHLACRLQEIPIVWWYWPIFAFFVTYFTSLCFMLLRRYYGITDRLRQLREKAAVNMPLQKSLYEQIQRHPDEYNQYIPTAIGVVGIVATGLYMWNKIRTNPEAELDLSKRRGNWSDWFTWNRQVPTGSGLMNMSSKETQNCIGKHLVVIKSIVDEQGKQREREVRGIYVAPGILVLPEHFFRRNIFVKGDYYDDQLLTMECNGVKHSKKVYKSEICPIEGKDLVVLFVARAPKMKKSIINLFPDTTGSDCHKANMLYKTCKDDKDTDNYQSEQLNVRYIDNVDCGGTNVGRGLEYSSSVAKSGYCGSPIVSDRRDGLILGLHTSSTCLPGPRVSYAQEILKGTLEKEIERLKNSVTYITTPESGDYNKPRLGFKMIEGPGHHPASKIYNSGELGQYGSIEILGHNKNLQKYRSRAKKTMISDSIAKICRKPNRWKGPDMSQPWKHHNAALIHLSNPPNEVPPEAIEWAVNDYLDGLRPLVDPYKKKHPNLCKILDIDQAVHGIYESMFMQHLNMKTSIGPIADGSGVKWASDLFEEIEPGDHNEKRWIMTTLAKQYFCEMLDNFRKGKKYGVNVRTCLKDEIVAEDSEKVRIFYIMECIFAILVRQYYLPIIEFLSHYPLTSETAVGINCASKEWSQMMDHLQEYAPDDVVTDWDYSKYDLRRSPDVMIASLNCYKEIGKMMGYSEDSLRIMDGIADELRNPIVNWNGTIMSVFLWSSGNSITVYGNGTENSLHNRCSFYVNGIKHLGREKFLELGSFRNWERIITYGDDGRSCSKKEYRFLSSFSAKKYYFDMIGMKITDAAKSNDPPEFLHKDESDFLKRKNVYHDALGTYVGALSQSSIWKMGHMTISREPEEDLAINAINSMLLEMFLHGEEQYENLRSDLQKVAKDVNIYTEKLDLTYQDRVQDWKEKYDH
jgi:hypothetical protein